MCLIFFRELVSWQTLARRTAALTLVFLAVNSIAALPTNTLVDAPTPGGSNTITRYSLTLPEGWSEMAPEQVAAIASPRKGTTGPRRTTRGYFLTNSTGLLPTPFISVEETGFRRIPENYLNMLANENLRNMAVFDHVRAEGVMENDIEETSYDTNLHLLRVTLERLDPVAGRLREINHIHYTEHGSITVTCAAKTSEFPMWTNVFSQVLGSFRVAPGEHYQSRPASEEAPVAVAHAQSALKFRFALMGIGIFGPLIAWFLKRRFGEVRSDEI